MSSARLAWSTGAIGSGSLALLASLTAAGAAAWGAGATSTLTTPFVWASERLEVWIGSDTRPRPAQSPQLAAAVHELLAAVSSPTTSPPGTPPPAPG